MLAGFANSSTKTHKVKVLEPFLSFNGIFLEKDSTVSQEDTVTDGQEIDETADEVVEDIAESTGIEAEEEGQFDPLYLKANDFDEYLTDLEDWYEDYDEWWNDIPDDSLWQNKFNKDLTEWEEKKPKSDEEIHKWYADKPRETDYEFVYLEEWLKDEPEAFEKWGTEDYAVYTEEELDQNYQANYKYLQDQLDKDDLGAQLIVKDEPHDSDFEAVYMDDTATNKFQVSHEDGGDRTAMEQNEIVRKTGVRYEGDAKNSENPVASYATFLETKLILSQDENALEPITDPPPNETSDDDSNNTSLSVIDQEQQAEATNQESTEQAQDDQAVESATDDDETTQQQTDEATNDDETEPTVIFPSDEDDAPDVDEIDDQDEASTEVVLGVNDIPDADEPPDIDEEGDEAIDGDTEWVLVTSYDLTKTNGGKVWAIPENDLDDGYVLISGLDVPVGICFDVNNDLLYVVDSTFGDQGVIYQYEIDWDDDDDFEISSETYIVIYKGAKAIDCSVDEYGNLYFVTEANQINIVSYLDLWNGYTNSHITIYDGLSGSIDSPTGISVIKSEDIWFTNSGEMTSISGVLNRADAKTDSVNSGQIEARVSGDYQAWGVAANDDYVFFTTDFIVFIYDLDDGEVSIKSKEIDNPRAIGYGDDYIYVVDQGSDVIYRLDVNDDEEEKADAWVKVAGASAVFCVNYAVLITFSILLFY